MMLKCFQSNLIKCIVNFEINMENLKKKRKYHIFKKTFKSFYCLHLIVYSVFIIMKTNFKEEESIEILKILGLINNIEEYQKYIIMSE